MSTIMIQNLGNVIPIEMVQSSQSFVATVKIAPMLSRRKECLAEPCVDLKKKRPASRTPIVMHVSPLWSMIECIPQIPRAASFMSTQCLKADAAEDEVSMITSMEGFLVGSLHQRRVSFVDGCDHGQRFCRPTHTTRTPTLLSHIALAAS